MVRRNGDVRGSKRGICLAPVALGKPFTCRKMPRFSDDVKSLRGDHPIFFWGVFAVTVLLLVATAAMAVRIPLYRNQAAELSGSLTDSEREIQQRILDSRARRGELALALLQREMRLRALEEDEVHLAIDLENQTFSLRHGEAVLRETPVTIGSDSTVVAPDGRSWRLVRPLGERHVEDKQRDPTFTVPEWAYVSRGETPPAQSARDVEGGLGEYVILLDDGTEIHTRPDAGPFAAGPHPGGFIVEDEDAMAAIFDAVPEDTPVYIF